jgi:hypothetical protein
LFVRTARLAPEKAVFRPALPLRSLPGLYGADMRKAVSKKVRFEVFKRDKFKCQYCGGEAPKVVLQVDHINPVAKGGKNDILNLITACGDCNNGKSDRLLSDDSAVNKQRQQLEELSERREQLEMMLKWRDGLSELADDQKQAIRDTFKRLVPGYSIKDDSKLPGDWLQKYPINKILDAIETAVHRYVVRGEDGTIDRDSVESALHKVGGILRMGAMEPDERRLYYIKGIVRNRMYMPHFLMADLKRAVNAGVDVDDIEYEAKTARNWTQFNQWLQGAISEAQGE